MTETLNQEQIEILKHALRSPGCLFCGDSPDMQALVSRHLMEPAGRKSFVPDEYFRITIDGKMALANQQEGRG